MSTDVLIYCNGDSYVNGYELGDTLLESHPGFIDYHPNQEKISKDAQEWYRNTYDSNHIYGKDRESKKKQIEKLERELVFSNLIKEKTNYDVINASFEILGNSQGNITRRSITDLYNLRPKYKKIFAIIATTSPNRLDLPDERGEWNNLMLGNRPPVTDDYTSNLVGLFDFYIRYGTDYHLLMNFYKNIILLKSFCKEYDIKLLLTTGCSLPNITGYEDKDDLEAFRKIANLSHDINLNEVAKLMHNNVWCPGYHVAPAVHEKASDMFIELISKEL